MKLPFLRQLPGLGRQPLHRIVADSAAADTGAEVALQYLLAELPELLLVAVVAVESGQVLASYTSQLPLRPSSAAPFWVAVVRQLQASLAVQGQREEPPQEVLLTTQSQLHLMRLRPDGQQFLYLVVGSHDTNLALARELMSQAIDLLIS